MSRYAHVLLVDGNSTSLYDTMMLLRDYCDCKISIASDADMVMEKVKKVWFDLILMDCSEQKVEAFETTRQIKKLVSEKRIEPVPVIGIVPTIGKKFVKTGMLAKLMSDDTTMHDKCKQAGFDDSVQKPLALVHLVKNQILRKILEPAQIKEVALNLGGGFDSTSLTGRQKDSMRVLGLNALISTKQIKNQYRKLVKQYHPDTSSMDDLTGQEFYIINRAYEYLMSCNLFGDTPPSKS